MNRERISLPLSKGPLEDTTAIWERPESMSQGAVLLANGAGFGLEAPTMEAIAHGLVARGHGVLRFNYPYKERQARGESQRPPDRRPILEHVHERAAGKLAELAPDARVLFAGKSMGGRIASHIAAQGVPCDGLVFFGFPLHAPGKPGIARAEHFAALAQPALFLQGTRDALCRLELLSEALERYGGRATVEVLEGADHGFHVPKKSGRTDAQVLEDMLDRVVRWERDTWPPA